MVLNPEKPPRQRPGFRWEWRDGCTCTACPWLPNCRGRDTEHWIEVKIARHEETVK